jgi:hypothetical protein
MILVLEEHHVTKFHQLNDMVLVELNKLLNELYFVPTNNENRMRLVDQHHTLKMN